MDLRVKPEDDEVCGEGGILRDGVINYKKWIDAANKIANNYK